MTEQNPTTERGVRPMWRIIPGLMIYNLFGRHLLRWFARRAWLAEGRDPTLAPRPGRIRLADIRSVNHGR